MTDIYPGLKVRCVREPRHYGPDASGDVLPTAGSIYTVRVVLPDGGVRLAEIINRHRRGSFADGAIGVDEPYFAMDYFILIRDDEHSIEIFRKIDKEVFNRVDA